MSFSKLKATADKRPVASVASTGATIDISSDGKKVVVQRAGGTINQATRTIATDAVRHLLFVNRQGLTETLRVPAMPRAGDQWPLAPQALARFAADDLDIQPAFAKGQAHLVPPATGQAGASPLQLVIEWQIDGHDAPVEGWKSESSKRTGLLRVSQPTDPLAKQVGEWTATRESTVVGTGADNRDKKMTRRYQTTGHLECRPAGAAATSGSPAKK